MRVFILCEKKLDLFRQAVFQDLLRRTAIEIVGAGINYRTEKSTWYKVKRELKKGRGGYVFIMIVKKLLRQSKAAENQDAEAFFHARGIPVFHFSKLYSEETVQTIKDQHPDCLFLNGFGIIKEPILSLTPYGVVSYHHGDMSKYRGGPPAFWELLHNEKTMGVTVQILKEGLDSGKILAFREFPIHRKDNWSSLRKRVYQESISMAGEAIVDLPEKAASAHPPEELGKIYTLPNLGEWMKQQWIIGLRKIGWL